MEAAVFVACMAIIAQINAAPTPEAESIAHHNNEFDLPPMALGGFDMNINVSVYATEDGSKKLKVIVLPEAEADEPDIPENCKNHHNTEGKHLCITPNRDWISRSGESQSITYHVINIVARLNDDGTNLTLIVALNTNFHRVLLIPLEDFDKLKHFSIGGIIDIKKLEFEFKPQLNK